MSILNVNQIQPVGSGQTVTISATNIDTGSATVTAGTFSGGVTVTSGNLTGITSVSTTNLTVNGNAYPSAGPLSNRNMLYNGAMVVNQRGYTSAASTTTGYSVDRWRDDSSSDAVIGMGQSTSVPTGQGFSSSLLVNVSTADNSLSSGQFFTIQQRLEGADVQRIKSGSSNAEQLTLSFWVSSSKTGTYICELYNYDSPNRQVSKSYTIDVANTWEKKILTFPADTTGNFDNDNQLSLIVLWWLAAGSSLTSGTLNTSWETVTNANRAVGQVNFLDTAGAQFNITGCQLEVGSVATPFEHRSFGDELARCQRYCYMIGRDTDYAHMGMGQCNSTTVGRALITFPQTMRTEPFFITSGNFLLTNATNTGLSITSFAEDVGSRSVYTLTCTVASGLVAGDSTRLAAQNDTSAYILFSAEL